ncbi:hypothetical protein NQ318_011587 [Aromia moschata]|uniref:Uncharacterized protein n=1 Tax=Aromia moschata TaxID=1265417 RepID=A0AAV8Z9C3_9CUCU|nr:hypothetical protein NQ318_011587 [Aromia moschata]
MANNNNSHSFQHRSLRGPKGLLFGVIIGDEWQPKCMDSRRGMRKVCAKLVPKVLTDDQKARLIETCQELLDTCEDNLDFLDDVITGDESWVFAITLVVPLNNRPVFYQGWLQDSTISAFRNVK